MSNATLHELAGQLRSRRIDRRRFMQGATALGVSGTAISSALRARGAIAQDATTVTFWTTFTDPDLSVIGGMVDTFNEQAEGYQVELVQIPPAQVTDVTQLMTAVRGGTGPDVYLLDRFIVAQRAADGLLQDLTEYGADEAVMSAHLPFARAEATYNGVPFALPSNTDARAIYYNRGALAEAGIEADELDSSNGPLTWSRIAELANQFNEEGSGGNYSRLGFVPWMNQGWHYTYGFSWGGTFFNADACEVTPDDPAIVEAFQWVQDYCVDLGAQQVQAFGGPTMLPGFPAQEHPFVIGTLGMQVTGDWMIHQLEQYAPDMDYGITFIGVPNEGDESATWAGGWSVVIPEGATNPEPAFEFMSWYAGEPGQRIYTEESAHLPTIAALIEEADLYSENHLFFSQQLLPIAKNRPPLPVGARYWDELTIAWQSNYLGEAEPAAALASVKERVQPDLARFCPIEG
ncbi:MAG: ABC transporter substrate-binding protein [Chloroflexota bacterium]|nr:ABC transporter substrate-binding protein [Chloroflexota bacterium]